MLQSFWFCTLAFFDSACSWTSHLLPRNRFHCHPCLACSEYDSKVVPCGGHIVASSIAQGYHQALYDISASEAVSDLNLVFLGRSDILDSDHASELFARWKGDPINNRDGQYCLLRRQPRHKAEHGGIRRWRMRSRTRYFQRLYSRRQRRTDDGKATTKLFRVPWVKQRGDRQILHSAAHRQGLLLHDHLWSRCRPQVEERGPVVAELAGQAKPSRTTSSGSNSEG